MATVEIEADVQYMLYGVSTVYSTARSTGTNILTDGSSFNVGQRYMSPNYQCSRTVFRFDTSSLSGATINQVNLRLRVYVDFSETDFDVQIAKYDWSSYYPVDSGNMDTVYDGVLAASLDDNIWRNSSGITTTTSYDSGNLSTAWVNTSSYTYYGLIGSTDRANSTPTDRQELNFRGLGTGVSSYRPHLVVDYTEGSASSTPIHLIRTGMQPGMRIGL